MKKMMLIAGLASGVVAATRLARRARRPRSSDFTTVDTKRPERLTRDMEQASDAPVRP